MGCSSSMAEQPIIRVISLEYTQIANYIDELPFIVLQKLSQKFNAYCNKSSQVTMDQFILMYHYSFQQKLLQQISDNKNLLGDNPSTNNQKTKISKQSKERTQTLLTRLFYYYTDLGKSKLKFKNFINKYSILTKASQQILCNAIFFINISISSKQQALKNIQHNPQMSKDQFNLFITKQKQYFDFKADPIISQQSISKKQFYQKLKQSGFNFDAYRMKFTLFVKDDFPFQQIGRKLVQMDINDYQIGHQYYIISTKWFQKWSFYYQGANDFLSTASFKSTKLIKNKKQLSKRKRSTKKSALVHSSSRQIDMDSTELLVERPNEISFNDIEGQFAGQLKDNIRVNYEIKVINQQIWQLLKKTMPAQNSFIRIANTNSTLQLYPKHIYFLRANQKGQIIDESLQIIKASIKTKLEQLYEMSKLKDSLNNKYKLKLDQNRSAKYAYFYKQFGQQKWYQEIGQRQLGRCSTQLRFFVVQAPVKSKFLEKYTRKQITKDNLTYGDKVSAYFSFTQKAMPAYILRLLDQSFQVHFIGYNYRYEIDVKKSQISTEQEFPSYLSESLRKSVDSFTYKGIRNIGNTCFINSIIQCLIATPIFGDYVIEETFDPKKQPLLHQISLVAKLLLKNEKVSPYELKKTIDMQLQIFSGNQQHDAQQFLGFLLDKFSNELKDTKKMAIKDGPSNIIQQLFQGKTSVVVKCPQCQNQSKNQQTVSIVSLPIPQPEFNTFSIFIFPISYKRIRKIVFRLHQKATLHQYLNAFQQRTGQGIQSYIFAENNAWTGKKIRTDFEDNSLYQKKLQDLGVTPSIEIFAYEKYSAQQIREISQQNRYNHNKCQYFDYYDTDDVNKWIYGKYVDKKKKNKIEVMEIQHPHKASTIKVSEQLKQMKDIAPLGSKTKQQIIRKIYLRKYNNALQKMEVFGFSLMIRFPKQTTLQQLSKLIDVSMQNYVYSKKSDKPYFIRIVQSIKPKCVFCEKLQPKYDAKGLSNCCIPTDQQKNIPLVWLCPQSNYMIYIQWHNFKEYNGQFSSAVEIDPLSSSTQKQKQEDKVQVQQCLTLFQKPQNVQMQCNKCKNTQQKRNQILKQPPNILILHLKQFRVLPSHVLVKLDVNMKWIQYLDISSFTENCKGSIYELYGYVRHTGTSNSGHYTCVTRRKHLFQKKKVWVNFDDDLTDIVQTEQKNIDSAYLLFFKKVDMPSSAYINFTAFSKTIENK